MAPRLGTKVMGHQGTGVQTSHGCKLSSAFLLVSLRGVGCRCDGELMSAAKACWNCVSARRSVATVSASGVGHREQPGQHQPVRQEQGRAEQQPASQGHRRGRDVEPEPGRTQRDPPGQHPSEQAVRGHPDPDRAGKQHPERQRGPGGGLSTQGPQRNSLLANDVGWVCPR
jgi:hypothetical protein